MLDHDLFDRVLCNSITLTIPAYKVIIINTWFLPFFKIKTKKLKIKQVELPTNQKKPMWRVGKFLKLWGEKAIADAGL